MNKYIVRLSFAAKSPAREQVMRKGEVIRLSSSKATSLVSNGLIVDANVGINLLEHYESRYKVLMEKLRVSREEAQDQAIQLVDACLRRHESLKISSSPSAEFFEEVDAFNSRAEGDNPISKIPSKEGAGEWAEYRCNFGQGCSHGCLYCYAENMAVVRFGRVESSEAWRDEVIKEMKTNNCKKYDGSIMFPTSHDISTTYLSVYRCHLFNILNAGNSVVIVSKPHRECIEAICREFSLFRDKMLFRFTIGGLNDEVMRHWEPGAPTLPERLDCLRYAFENGYNTSVSAEPMLCGREEAEKLYYTVVPYVTKDIWFGKMKYIGGLKNNLNPVIADQAKAILESQSTDEILRLVDALKDLPKVAWKDSIKELMK